MPKIQVVLSMSRIWNLRFNLDDFNGVVATLCDDHERASFLLGMSCGCNGGKQKDAASQPWMDGYGIGQSMRAEAETYKAGKSEAGHLSAEARKKKYGSAQPSSPDPEQTSNTARTQLEQTSNTAPNSARTNLQSTIHNPKTTKRQTKKDTPDGETLEMILGPKGSETWEAYWRLVGVFGPAKNPSPKATARAYKVSLDHSSHDDTLCKAQALLKATSDPKYMPQLSKWLEGQGYLNPDTTPKAANNAPAHRRSQTDDAYIRQLESRMGRQDVPEVRGGIFDFEEAPTA